MFGKQLCGELLVAEDVLRARLAVVEVAAHAPHIDVAAALRCHLAVLDIADAAIGVHNRDADMVKVAESFERRLAGVARRGNQDKEVVVKAALLAQLRGGGAEEARQALQRHVLKRAGRAMPQFKHVGVGVKRRDGTDALIVEVAAVCLTHKLVDGLRRQVHAESAIDAGRALSVRKLGKRTDIVDGQLGNVHGDVQAAAIGKAVDNSFRELDGFGNASARVDVAIVFHGL